MKITSTIITCIIFSALVFSTTPVYKVNNLGTVVSDDNAKRVAIFYFDNTSGDSNLEKLKKGLADMLITDLSGISALSIVERDKLEELIKEQQLSRSKGFDASTASKLGKLLGAEIILTGAFFEMFGTFRIDARFIDVETGTILKSDGVEGPTSSFFKLQKQLAWKIITNLGVTLNDDEKASLNKAEKNQEISYQAALMYSEALENFDAGENYLAIEKLNSVLEENPHFLPAQRVLDKLLKNALSADIERTKIKSETDLMHDKDVTKSQLRGSGDPLKGLNVAAAKNNMQIGKYYALIIGIDNYKGAWSPLQNAVNDARAVENLLKDKYRFDHFNVLYDDLATRKNIMQQLQWLVDNATENDNVFIFYSGHGEFKQDLNKGYWVPVEAHTTETYEFISNSDIQTYLNGIKTKHTLLIADACFSGDIFRGSTVSVPFEQSSKYYEKVMGLKSRQAITSGGIEPVMDGGREGHSVFTYYLLEMLKRNDNKYYDAGQLYNDLKIPVTNNSNQSPLIQPIKNTGDEGGQFVFIKK